MTNNIIPPNSHSDPPSQAPHRHLPPQALWEWAEALVFAAGKSTDLGKVRPGGEVPEGNGDADNAKGAQGQSNEAALGSVKNIADAENALNSADTSLQGDVTWNLPEGYSRQAMLNALACPQCGPTLRLHRRQIEEMRSLPELKAPPDFLALVQARIAAESSPWHRLLGMISPSRPRGMRLPLGFASALLLVVVLVVVMPQSPLHTLITQEEKTLASEPEVAPTLPSSEPPLASSPSASSTPAPQSATDETAGGFLASSEEKGAPVQAKVARRQAATKPKAPAPENEAANAWVQESMAAESPLGQVKAKENQALGYQPQANQAQANQAFALAEESKRERASSPAPMQAPKARALAREKESDYDNHNAGMAESSRPREMADRVKPSVLAKNSPPPGSDLPGFTQTWHGDTLWMAAPITSADSTEKAQQVARLRKWLATHYPEKKVEWLSTVDSLRLRIFSE